MNRRKLESLTKAQLVECISGLCNKKILKWKQIDEILNEQMKSSGSAMQVKPKSRLSQEYISQNMEKALHIFDRIEEQKLMMSAYWYEDYSEGYWNSTEVYEYDDTDGIVDMLIPIIKLAVDCMEDCWYEEALTLYDRLLDMEIYADDECDGVMIGLEELVSENLLKTDLKSICLNTLYCDYQVRDKKDRIEDIHAYFGHLLFREIHIQDMFRAGRQQLEGEEEFWNEWIQYLLTLESDMDSRLLKEAVEYYCDVKTICEFAEKYYQFHPALYLYAIEAYVQERDYEKALQLSKNAMQKLDDGWTMRSTIAKKAVEIAECINDREEKYYYCYEAFRSNSNVKNFLALFENKDIAEKYGRNAKTLLESQYTSKGDAMKFSYKEKEINDIGEYTYNFLLFFTGDITVVKNKCRNPSNSLGWSGCFIKQGIELFLMYLYHGEYMETEKALGQIGGYFGRIEGMEERQFFELFQKWKLYYPMEMIEKENLLKWAETIIRKRVDAIVGGQHRRQYGEVAMLLGAMAEIKESWGEKGMKQTLRQEYQKKYPRHSAFQGELNMYLGTLKK